MVGANPAARGPRRAPDDICLAAGLWRVPGEAGHLRDGATGFISAAFIEVAVAADDVMPCLLERWDEDGADIAEMAGDKDPNGTHSPV